MIIIPLFACVGELGCHSEDTKVLTPSGIKDWRELKVGDKVLGVDRTFRIVEATIKNVFVYRYKGPMIHFFSRRYDFLVTPNHRMIFRGSWERNFHYIRADEIISKRINGHFPVYSNNIHLERFSLKNYKIEESYDGIVWCFETDTGNFFTVRNGKVGLSGNSGKTLSAVYLVWRNYKKFQEENKRILEAAKQDPNILNYFEFKHVYSNITLYGIPHYRLRTICELNWAKSGIVLLDELWAAGLDSRMSRRKKNIVTANILGKSRKKGLTILFTVQTISQLDRRIREVLDFIAYPILSPDNQICRLMIWRGNKPKGPPLQVVRFFTEEIFKFYNTREEVEELIDDTDEEGLGERVPEFCYIPVEKNPAWQEYLLAKKYGFKKII